MTYIEFLDENAAENICAALSNIPERVVLVGDKYKVLKSHADRYKKIFLNRGYDVEFICRSANKNSIKDIIETLSYLIETYDDCVFDLTGGEDLFLVALGIVSERYKDKKIKMQRFNLKSGTVIDCDYDGETIMEEIPEITVRENVEIYGGDIVYDTVKNNGTHIWDMNEEFCRDIISMWKICKNDVREWNAQIGIIKSAYALSSNDKKPLEISVSVKHLKDVLAFQGIKFFIKRFILEGLYEAGLLTYYEYTEENLRIVFKNEQIKKCLTKAGQALEMLIYVTALNVRDKDGNIVYNDVMNGVCIDWDGEIEPKSKRFDTENEIDIVMIHGIVPVFVSCKNGAIEIDELYKLNSVAEKFGGRYAKKVLVATALDCNGTFDDYFRQRAEDMNIRLVEGIQKMSQSDLEKSVRSFWSN